jgi:hypothetical protein
LATTLIVKRMLAVTTICVRAVHGFDQPPAEFSGIFKIKQNHMAAAGRELVC